MKRSTRGELAAAVSSLQGQLITAQLGLDKAKEFEPKLLASEQRVAALEKELAQVKQTSSYYNAQKDQAQAELDAVHTVLDEIPGCLPRKLKDGYSEHKLMTRFAVWLATSRTNAEQSK